MLASNGWSISCDRSPVLFFCALSVFLAYLSAVLAFPSFRFAKMYRDSLKLEVSFVTRCAIKLSILIPPLLMILWCKPTVSLLMRQAPSVMKDKNVLDCLRLLFVFLLAVCRLISALSCLQSYLNLGLQSLMAVKSGGGRINFAELQQTVNRYFIYFPVVLIQYLVPVILLVSVSLLLKSLGNMVSFAANLRGISLPVDSLSSANLENGVAVFNFKNMLSPSVCAEFWAFFLFHILLTSSLLTFIGFVYVT
ncbi:unnamed protein product [Soboliphyme baturini]|uniref:Transmembrane channel-like protein n=1 Tax=Soboliphyme baturini TaxID=241478 RepID=A0A183IM52_9BILA|nr:unnamed protein product [Soboliphyme baturini]